jgi:hypothetical protein
MRLLRLLPLLLALALPLSATAGRIFPQNLKFGEMKGVAYPAVQIGDTVYHSAPGLRIYDRSNRMILPVALPQSAVVLFQLDIQGNLSQLWLLTPEEEASVRQAVGR